MIANVTHLLFILNIHCVGTPREVLTLNFALKYISDYNININKNI